MHRGVVRGRTGADDLADADGGVPLRHLFAILRRRSRLVAWILVCGAIATAALALLLPARYTAKAQVVIEESRAPPIDQRAAGTEGGPDQASMQTQVAALSSHDLLVAVLARLSADQRFRDMRRRGAGPLPELSVGNETRALERLERHLHVYQEAGSHVISIAYTSTNPVEAALIANKITDYYLAAGEDQSRLATNQAASAIADKLAELRKESEAHEAAVAAYQAAHGMNDAYKTNVIDQKLEDLNHQLAIAQAELAARRARHAELSAMRGARGDWQPLLGGLDTQGLLDLHGQLVAARAGRQEGVVVPPNAGAVAAGEAAPPPLLEKVRRELNQALLKLSSDEHVAIAQVAAIEERLSAVQRASDDVQLRDLVSAAESAHRRYDRLVQRRNELLAQADDITAPARLLSWADVPHRPSSLNPMLLAAPALIALLLVAGLAALLREQLDQGIYDGSDVAAALGVRCAGLVPWSARIVSPKVAAGASAQATLNFAEALRGVLVSLQLVALGGRRPQVILVTSSVPGEGKTTLARGLGTCAARTGARVLLLDPNEWAEEGSPPRSLQGFSGGPVARTEDLPATHSAAGLDYLPMRRAMAPESTALLSIEKVSNLLQGHRATYDLIFIDGASVLTKAEVRLLAALADQIVLAVRWRKTRRDDARAALDLLRDCGARQTRWAARISVALTQVEAPRVFGGFAARES